MSKQQRPYSRWLGQEYKAADGTIKRAPLVRSEPKIRMSKKDRKRLRALAIDGIMAELDKPQPDVLDALKALRKEAIFERIEPDNSGTESSNAGDVDQTR